MRAPIGLKIRNYRKVKGLSQAALAKSAGISPSYLNLIEANKRHVGGSLLHRLAQNLKIDLHDLTGETELRMINELCESFADPLLAPMKLSENDAHQMVAQLPVMAKALHTCFRGYLDSSATANALSNRLQSDPVFSQLLHQILSRITAIRSSAEILQNMPDITTEQRASFHSSIFSESRSLSDTAQALLVQFDQEVEQHNSITPQREVNDMIIGENNYFPSLEKAADDVRSNLFSTQNVTEKALINILMQRHNIQVIHTSQHTTERQSKSSTKSPKTSPLKPALKTNTISFSTRTNASTRRFQLAQRLAILEIQPVIENLCKDKRLTSSVSRSLAFSALAAYFAGALIFPYSQFLVAARDCGYDVDFLSQQYGASFEQIAHRLVTLRKSTEAGIPFGFLRADPSGYLTKQFPLPGLIMPNAGHACPLWAIYASLRSPNIVIRQIVSFSDGSRYLFIAKTSAKQVETFNDIPVFSAIMLVCNLIQADKTIYAKALQLNDKKLDIPVGPACSLCVRSDCAHRNSPMASVPVH